MRNLLLLVAIAAMLTACQHGGNRPEYVGQVNDHRIAYDSYINQVRRAFESYRLEHLAMPQGDERQLLIDSTWNGIVRSLVLNDLFQEYGIHVSQDEVMDSLLANPPAFVRESRLLQINGKFSPALYENALNTGEPADLEWLKQEYYNSVIPVRKLRQAVLGQIPVSEEELQAEFKVRYGSARADVVAVPVSAMPQPRVSQPEIRAWYDKHRAMFNLEPSCDLRWVLFPVVPSHADSMAARARVDSLYQRLQEGEHFGTLARLNSDAASAVLGGDIGYVALDSLDARVHRQLASRQWQVHTNPILVDGQWVIYRPVRKTQSMVKLQELVVRPQASRNTLSAVLEEVKLFRELTNDVGMERAAQEFDLQMHEQNGASREAPELPGLGRSERMVSQAFEEDAGTVFEPMYHDGLHSYVLMQVVSSEPGGARPLFEVSDMIADTLRTQRRMESALQEAQALAREADPMGVARSRGYVVLPFPQFEYTSALAGTWRPELNRRILLAKPGKWTALDTVDDYAWAWCTQEVTLPATTTMQQHHAELTTLVRESKRQGYFESWLTQQVKKARVKDWRPTLPMFQ